MQKFIYKLTLLSKGIKKTNFYDWRFFSIAAGVNETGGAD